jgi:hypothetical protein
MSVACQNRLAGANILATRALTGLLMTFVPNTLLSIVSAISRLVHFSYNVHNALNVGYLSTIVAAILLDTPEMVWRIGGIDQALILTYH